MGEKIESCGDLAEVLMKYLNREGIGEAKKPTPPGVYTRLVDVVIDGQEFRIRVENLYHGKNGETWSN